jgi:hypothetical protein
VRLSNRLGRMPWAMQSARDATAAALDSCSLADALAEG